MLEVSKKILFIVNPISGGKKKMDFPKLVDRYLNHTLFDAHIEFTSAPKHAHDLALAGIAEQYDYIIAVGGDGTINEVASALVGTNIALGIVPLGSGNGLARTLRIPTHIKKAIQMLNHAKERPIDVGWFNEKPFFNVAGLGFDAHISHLFQQVKGRGFLGYVQTILSEIATHKAEKYKLHTENEILDLKAYAISIANSTQFGNNAHIAPLAKLDDGLLDVVIFKNQSKLNFPFLGFRIYNKTLHQSSAMLSIQIKEISIEREKEGYIHIDGEPFWMGHTIKIRVQKHGLRILAI